MRRMLRILLTLTGLAAGIGIALLINQGWSISISCLP